MLTLRTKRETNRIPLVRAGGFKLFLLLQMQTSHSIPLVRAGGFKLCGSGCSCCLLRIPLVRAGGFKPRSAVSSRS